MTRIESNSLSNKTETANADPQYSPDHIYKFLTFLGLAGNVFLVSLIAIKYEAANEKVQTTNRLITANQIEMGRLEVTLEQHDPFISEHVNKKIARVSTKPVRGKPPDNLFEIDYYVCAPQATAEVRTQFEQINDILRDQSKFRAEVKLQLMEVESTSSRFYKVLAACIFGMGLLSLQYVVGFRLWYKRVQIPEDKKRAPQEKKPKIVLP